MHIYALPLYMEYIDYIEYIITYSTSVLVLQYLFWSLVKWSLFIAMQLLFFRSITIIYLVTALFHQSCFSHMIIIWLSCLHLNDLLPYFKRSMSSLT